MKSGGKMKRSESGRRDGATQRERQRQRQKKRVSADQAIGWRSRAEQSTA